MKRTLLLIALAILLLPKWIFAQAPVDYRDVAVIVNTNSKTSVAIGDYFMAKKKIPAGNLIKYSGSVAEVIDSLGFDSAMKSIGGSLKKLSGINYLVTTKGCPLKVNHGGNFCDLAVSGFSCARQINASRCASFEAELMLIDGKYAGEIGMGDVLNDATIDSLPRLQPYFEKQGHFYHSQYDIYLVTRLDGYDTTGIKLSIDNNGPNTLVDKSTAQFVLDNFSWKQLLTFVGPDTTLHNSFMHAYNMLTKRGWTVNIDSTEKLINNQKNILGYISWGYTDTAYKNLLKKTFLNNTYTNAALGAEYYSYTGKTLTWGVTGYKATALPYLKNGMAGAAAHVYEPLSFAMIEPVQLFDKYTDVSVDRRYNLAECYYSASATMSWMTTIVGDPKTSIITAMPARPKVSVDTITKICNNTPRIINSKGSLPGNYNWFSTDSTTLKASGTYMDSTNANWAASGKNFSIPTNLKPGKYSYTYVNENISGRSYGQVTFNVVLCDGISENQMPLASMEIYPNPAHNMFTVSYKGLNYQQAVLIITDALGREVYTRNISNTTDLKQDINLDGEPSGIYFINLTTGNQSLVSKLILK